MLLRHHHPGLRLSFAVGAFSVMLALVCWSLGIYAAWRLVHQSHKESKPENAVVEQPQESDVKSELLLVSAFIRASNPSLSPESTERIAMAILQNALDYNLPVGLVVAVTKVESNFRVSAVGPKTKHGQAMGPMQVMWPVHKDLAGSVGVDIDGIKTADGGMKVGCLLLSRYISAEQSITGGLIRFFSQASSTYVLDRVMTAYFTYRQLAFGMVGVDGITEAHKREVAAMQRLTRNKKGAN